MKMLMVRECSLPTITANDCSLGGLLSRQWTCTTAMCTCVQLSPAVSGLHRALSRRGRQRGRLPRARGRQDRQGGAQLQALGGRRGAALQYIQPSLLYMCTAARIVYTIPLITGIYQITVVSHSVHILTYCGASARSSSDLVYCIQQCRS